MDRLQQQKTNTSKKSNKYHIKCSLSVHTTKLPNLQKDTVNYVLFILQEWDSAGFVLSFVETVAQGLMNLNHRLIRTLSLIPSDI